jgi:Ca2+-binding RTX toxin-like protein
MHVRLHLAAAAAVGLFAVPHAGGGEQVELLQCLEAIPTIVGTPGDDVLAGTNRADVIAGRGGDDVITASWGDDIVCGGDGDDRISAGTGLFETDLVSGDAGSDVISTGSSFTVVLYAFAPRPVRVDLEEGVATGWGADTLIGVQRVAGTEFDDVLRGRSQFDCLDGLEGDDVLEAGPGADCLYGGTGNDTLDGGEGADLLSFRYSARPVRANLATGVASGEGVDRLAGVEDVVGSSFADVLTGDAGANVLTGEGGTDRLAGGAGADRLDGGPGRDRIDGGIGRDRCLNAEWRVHCP